MYRINGISGSGSHQIWRKLAAITRLHDITSPDVAPRQSHPQSTGHSCGPSQSANGSPVPLRSAFPVAAPSTHVKRERMGPGLRLPISSLGSGLIRNSSSGSTDTSTKTKRFQICLPTPEQFVRPLQAANKHFHYKMTSNTLFLEIKTEHKSGQDENL